MIYDTVTKCWEKDFYSAALSSFAKTISAALLLHYLENPDSGALSVINHLLPILHHLPMVTLNSGSNCSDRRDLLFALLSLQCLNTRMRRRKFTSPYTVKLNVTHPPR